MSEQHQEGLAHLLYGISQGGGFVALTGEVGTGKTTLCHCLLQQLPENIDIALVFNPKLNAVELLATICDELQIDYDKNKQTLKNLIDALNQFLLTAHAAGRRIVLLIDEAQNLSLNVLEQIRLLTNLETSTTKLLQIILVGQPELNLILAKPQLRQLNQRITARYHLTPLSLLETQHYIQHRLSVCGGSNSLFNRKAINKVFKLSGGIPRLINIICDRALLGGYVNDKQIIDAVIISKAAKEVLNPQNTSKGLLKKILISVLVVAVFAGFISYLIQIQPVKKHSILKGSFNKTVIEELQQTEIKKPQQYKTELSLNSYLKQRGLQLDAAITKLAQLWGKTIHINEGCKNIKNIGLQCLFDKSDWQSLSSLDRPIILELNLSASEKTYVVVKAFKNEILFLEDDSKYSFTIEQVKSFWDGYYLMIWQPPFQNSQELYLGESSEAVVWIKKQLGLKDVESDLFDDALKVEVINFQLKNNLTADGIVGARTFINLSNIEEKNNAPRLKN